MLRSLQIEGGLVADCVNNLFKELRVASAQ